MLLVATTNVTLFFLMLCGEMYEHTRLGESTIVYDCTVDVKPKSFTVSPFPRFRRNAVRSLPFTSATPQLVRRAERSRSGELWGRERRLFLRTVGTIGLSQALEHVKMRFATSIL